MSLNIRSQYWSIIELYYLYESNRNYVFNRWTNMILMGHGKYYKYFGFLELPKELTPRKKETVWQQWEKS